MILADKIARLRKQNGWSQEELAARMNVSRQAVSKWESAQSAPDLERILQMSELFGVTTDYLLKDSIEEEAASDIPSPVRRVTLSEANDYLDQRAVAARRIALATFMCVLSPIPLMLLAAASETPGSGISEIAAAGTGLIALLAIVAAAVAIFMRCGSRNTPYEFLDKEEFDTEYGVSGMVSERSKAFQSAYTRMNTLAACICILSPAPLFAGMSLENSFLTVALVALTMLIAGAGAALFTLAGVRQASYKRLLREGEFSRAERGRSRLLSAISTAFWLTATAVYLAWSFAANDWKLTWIVWPVAGVLYAGVMAVCNVVAARKEG